VWCCFCGNELVEAEPGLLTLIAVAVPEPGKAQARSEQFWCHAGCFGARLHEGAAFGAGTVGSDERE